MTGGFWAALGGYALGSAQVLALDWIRSRAQHRRQLRLLRAELRRLSGLRAKFGWQHGVVPATDKVPIPPRVTPSYLRVIQETDFWLTDEHSDDNTQEGLLNISDGCAMLERYASDAVTYARNAGAATEPKEKLRLLERAMDTAIAYDKEHDVWQVVVASALGDVERRLKQATTGRQVLRVVRRMPSGSNPPSLPPAVHD